MSKKVIFISDFFIDEIRGGAEFCNDALINSLKHKFTFERHKSETITLQFINDNRDCFFIVANFFLLREDCKTALRNATYVIFEHDHKYIKSNNPSLYKGFLAPESQLQNKEFFKNALAVICQSKKHSKVVQKNLLLNNVVNSAGNIWTTEQIGILEKNLNAEKTIEFAILNSQNKNKGMPAAIDFCNKNNLPFEYLNAAPFEKYIENMSKIKHLIFFPQWLESYSRLAIEARILGCKLVTNNLLGAASEDYFKLKGRELLEYIKGNNTIIVNRWIKLIDTHEIDHIKPIKLPKITVFCPIYNAEKYIENFLQDMKNQTIFDDCELIIINANSPQNEDEYIHAFMEENKNVVYKKLDYRATVMETENMALKRAKGEFFAQSCVDDAHAPEYLEILAKHLHFSEDIDLVYADCFQTNKPHETFEDNSSNGKRYEHSLNGFSKENMIKCLPGPMPMWKKSVHDKCGYFNEEMAHAGDWEMFLRMVEAGCKFKKVDRPLGLYFYNAEGLSTGVEYAAKRGKEEAAVFFEHKDTFGERNYQRYEPYFKQFLEA
jgi:glycosyltransferase involved in cell wall biosynthesis